MGNDTIYGRHYDSSIAAQPNLRRHRAINKVWATLKDYSRFMVQKHYLTR